MAVGYSSNVDAAEAMATKLRAEGASISIHQGNVGEPIDCWRVVDEVIAQIGEVDYLVNNAGIMIDKTVSQMTVGPVRLPSGDMVIRRS